MYVEEDLEAAVRDHPLIASDALAAAQIGDAQEPLEADALDAAARMFGSDRGVFWIQRLAERGLMPLFARALASRGLDIDLGEEPVELTGIDPADAKRFVDRAVQFRCRIMRNGVIVGSGVLVGPSTVLTAWHVLAPVGPYEPHGPVAPVEVLLSDGRRLRARLVEGSPCSECEFTNRLPANDNAVDALHDVALLRLSEPAGAQLGYADLADPPVPYRRPGFLLLVHFPSGADRGFGEGATERIRGLRSRVGHTVVTEAGSSGGGCFDTGRLLVGIHQGRRPDGRGRFVPLERFAEMARRVVEADVAPPTMWSLDGTPRSPLVIGRADFFTAYAASVNIGLARGVRVRRVDPLADPAGLPFTHAMLAGLIARDRAQRLLRLAFEAPADEVAATVVRRARDAGFEVGQLRERPGVATGESAPEAVGADLGRQAATLLDAAARRAGVVLWLFVEEPSTPFGDRQRATLEGFLAQALRLAALRLVVAGYEAAPIPGAAFEVGAVPDAGPPGLINEYVSGFGRPDVERTLALAAGDAGRAAEPAALLAEADTALAGLAHVNGVYAPWLAARVAAALAPVVGTWFEGLGDA